MRTDPYSPHVVVLTLVTSATIRIYPSRLSVVPRAHQNVLLLVLRMDVGRLLDVFDLYGASNQLASRIIPQF